MSARSRDHTSQCLHRWEAVLGALEQAVTEEPAHAGGTPPPDLPATGTAGLPPLPTELVPRATALLSAIDRRRLELALQRDAVAAELTALGRSERPGGAARGSGPPGTTRTLL